LAAKVSLLLKAAPMISRSLASRYPVVIFDEHQDASADQHTIALACLQGGARVRIFGDPMQRIYGSSKKAQVAEDLHRWRSVNEVAEVSDKLDTPHRWKDAPELGTWILAARETLKGGGKIDLRGGLPTGLSVIAAENDSSQPQGYTVAHPHNVPIYKVINEKKKLLVLAAHNSTVDALHAFFGRKLVIWEGHGRESLSTLVEAVHLHDGNAAKVTAAAIDFLGSVSTGFSRSAFGDRLLSEVTGGCSKRCTGKPATLQVLGRIILSEPNHKGVAKFFLRLNELRDTDEVFSVVKLNYRSEFWDAVRLAHFDDVKEGYAEIARRRTARRPLPPHKAISTIHKAKGLECEDALLIPCDQKHFPDTPAGRCRLYVALSRAMRTLTIVVSKKNPSPLLVV
jgi:DNA helicase-2/ATP-dependent DNA helicase PcrA